VTEKELARGAARRLAIIRHAQGVVIDDTGLFNERLREWEDFYNFSRHGALGGETPCERRRAKTRGSV
jgi:transposase InsO family protein